MCLYFKELCKEMTVLDLLISNSLDSITFPALKLVKLLKKIENFSLKVSVETKANFQEKHKDAKLSILYKTSQPCMSKCQTILWLTDSIIVIIKDN